MLVHGNIVPRNVAFR